MIVHWLAYSVAVSCLLGAAGFALERVCRLQHWPSRWIWALLLVTPFLLPFAASTNDSSAKRDREAAVIAERQNPPAVSSSAEAAGSANTTRQAAYRLQRLTTSPGVASLLIILWLGGFAFHVGGSLIHILIVIALILLIYRLATGRRVL